MHRPSLLHIETTSKCNAKCTFCAHPTMRRPREDMSDAVFSRILTDIRPWFSGTVFPFLNGELLTDKKIWKRMAMLAELPVVFGIHTNGALLTKDVLKKLSKFNIQYLMISLNASNAADHQRCTGLRCWEHLMRTIPEIHGTLGVRPSVLFTGDTNARVAGRIAARLGAQLQMAYKYTWRGRVTAPTGVQVGPCEWLYDHLFILSNGEIVPCCMDLEGEGSFGNIMQKGLLDVYNSPELDAYRTTGRDALALCNVCNMPPARPEQKKP